MWDLLSTDFYPNFCVCKPCELHIYVYVPSYKIVSRHIIEHLKLMSLQNADPENFTIYIHSKPGFVFDESVTRSAFFYNRQLKNSVEVTNQIYVKLSCQHYQIIKYIICTGGLG